MLDFRGSAEARAICISTVDRRIVFTNDSHLKMLGRPRSEVVGADWRTWMTPQGFEAAEDRLAVFRRNKEPYDILTQVLRADGEMVAIVAHCSAIKGETSDRDLVFCEMQTLDATTAAAESDRFACARLVRDLTYELARQTGRSRFRQLTNDLIAASASAEKAVDMLRTVAAELAR